VTPERLAEIRKATALRPRAFDDNGRPIIQASLIRDIGCVAIQHRRELLELVDETQGENAQLRTPGSVKLLAALRLLGWAVEFVEEETECLRQSYRTPNGDITDDDVAVQLQDAQNWLKETRDLLK
jgi:hypothetical protein